jgi:hypothetical protein
MVMPMVFLSGKKSFASPSDNLDIDAEMEYKLTNFDRDPQPAQVSTGTNFAQQYWLNLEGGLLDQGYLDSAIGLRHADLYTKNETEFEDKLLYEYGRWLRLEGRKKEETDEEIFFSGATEPQSPIQTSSEKYGGRVAINRSSSFEYSWETQDRRDLFFGTIVGEKTETQTTRFNTGLGPLNVSSEYKLNDFKDLLGTRSNVDSSDFNLEMLFDPQDSVSISLVYEDNKDKDLLNNTQLHSQNSLSEISYKPSRYLRLRNRFDVSMDDDTKTGETIDSKADEVIVNFDPVKQIGFEAAYKKEAEDKEKDSSDINSEINEKRIKMSLAPLTKINIQTGYEIDDKSSDATTENIEDKKFFSNISLEPMESLRLGGNYANTKLKNTFTSVAQSDTTSTSLSAQYRPQQRLSVILQGDRTKTDNPSTGAFTNTDTISSNFSMELTSYLDMSLRTSGQETTGSSLDSASRRLLNSLQLNVNPIKDLKFSAEYETIESQGPSGSDEDLFDVSFLYLIGKFDLSLRLQNRSVSGDNASDKMTVLGDIKCKFHTDAVLSFRASFIDFNDRAILSNSYDSMTLENVLSIRF